MLGADPAVGRQHDGALDRVLELVHVARPLVAHEHLEGLVGEAFQELAVELGVAGEQGGG